MIIRWSVGKTVGKMTYGRASMTGRMLMLDTVITWRVLWVLCIPVFAMAIEWERDR